MQTAYTLKLAHINDTHSHFEPSRIQFNIEHHNKSFELYSHTGGYARLQYQVKQARLAAQQNQQEFLFLHAGDSFQGTLYFNQFKGAANAHLLSMMTPDAMVLGNHEIDAGNGPVKEFIQATNFPILAGNMDLSREQKGKVAPLCGEPRLYDYDPVNHIAKPLIRSFHDRQLAIVGITLDQMKEIARPDADVHFIDAIATTRNTVQSLKKQGIHHIIVLSHLGLQQDRILAQEVEGISLIVGGHTHTLQGDFRKLGRSNLTYGERVNETPIVHAGLHAETLGLANIEFDASGKVTRLLGNNNFMLDEQFLLQSPQDVDEDDYEQIRSILTDHPGILWDEEDVAIRYAIGSQYRPAIDALEHQILAFVPKTLQHSRLPSKHLPHGSEISPWVSKSMYHEAREVSADIDFALHNAGGVRHSLEQGKISVADIIGRVLPFELPLVRYQIQGCYLIEAIESAINAATNNGVIGTGAGSFPYTYGLKYHYDGRQPIGSRLQQLQILDKLHPANHDIHNQELVWKPIETHHYYVGVSSSYTASGKEGYQALLQSCWQKDIQDINLAAAFMQFARKKEVIDQPLAPQLSYISQHS
ncbi:bifunctional metallophosphatase/5'-nucleotidase [Shewanella gelidii]|uniref:Bifunctional metallophosphatase/5'-nucleotidase n=1 Tax=Shewanella gelidii TaxID=1642821 RepID=A0A917N5Q0_9GAMM|nr:bifunctional metallophosphatase/5'-nucleotidase [Shewanella gelidii]MCL1096524.1 bifunctional metallophosphatase/5'-nucleotidase [Shewanella gelidii]GGI68039.1 bifunctional metallophosphatase/5'-nucleotidase [Shewanella gelidii]